MTSLVARARRRADTPLPEDDAELVEPELEVELMEVEEVPCTLLARDPFSPPIGEHPGVPITIPVMSVH